MAGRVKKYVVEVQSVLQHFARFKFGFVLSKDKGPESNIVLHEVTDPKAIDQNRQTIDPNKFRLHVPKTNRDFEDLKKLDELVSYGHYTNKRFFLSKFAEGVIFQKMGKSFIYHPLADFTPCQDSALHQLATSLFGICPKGFIIDYRRMSMSKPQLWALIWKLRTSKNQGNRVQRCLLKPRAIEGEPVMKIMQQIIIRIRIPGRFTQGIIVERKGQTNNFYLHPFEDFETTTIFRNRNRNTPLKHFSPENLSPKLPIGDRVILESILRRHPNGYVLCLGSKLFAFNGIQHRDVALRPGHSGGLRGCTSRLRSMSNKGVVILPNAGFDACTVYPLDSFEYLGQLIEGKRHGNGHFR